MRNAPGRATIAAMKKQRLVLDAAIDRSVIRGTLTAPTGERREFHGWLELHTALEAMLHASGRREQPGHGQSLAEHEGARHDRDEQASRPSGSGCA
jgi:hypothetical protein